MGMGAKVTTTLDGVTKVFDFGTEDAAIKWADEHYLEYDQIEVQFLYPREIKQGKHLYDQLESVND